MCVFLFEKIHTNISHGMQSTVFIELVPQKSAPIYEPHNEKTGFLHVRIQRRRSASR